MFGYRDEFPYFQCGECGCLQIIETPKDLAKYYPATYYSFTQRPDEVSPEQLSHGAKQFMNFYLPERFALRESSILDVGCGSGQSVYALRELGYANAFGVDRYLDEPITYKNGATILKGGVGDIAGGLPRKWDLIMFNHSFEHMADPIETLQTVRQMLSSHGLCFIRIPTVSSYAWEHYATNWVQLDAPRHFFLYSLKAMEYLARRCGLRLQRAIYDSTSFQFWGSELYLLDIPLCQSRNHLSVFSESQMRLFETKAAQLNREKRGDQAAFYLIPHHAESTNSNY
jgi:SAM-dependent methyltransferase